MRAGLSKGHPTTVRALPKRPSNLKASSSKSRVLVKGVIREVAGFAPYERRTMELFDAFFFLEPKFIELTRSGPSYTGSETPRTRRSAASHEHAFREMI